MLCQCGCGRKAKFRFKNGKFCCENHVNKCPNSKARRSGPASPFWKRIFSKETLEKMSKSAKKYGEKNPFFGKKHSEETKKHWSKVRKGKNNFTQSGLIKIKERMLGGGASYANSFVKDPSKPQTEVFRLVKQIFPSAEINYPFLNKSLDVAIPELKIWFEYDGNYWHPNKEKDLQRQKLIEEQGWKCIRYKDFVPTEEQLRSDIREVLR